jgi:hypothetical protein
MGVPSAMAGFITYPSSDSHFFEGRPDNAPIGGVVP